MIRKRRRDQGHFGGHPRPEFMILVAIAGILLAIAIPNLVRMRDAKKPKCLDHLAALTAGPLPADTVCPASKKPYGGGETIACTAPQGHLDSGPRFVKSGSGSWRLEQSLPVYAGRPVELGDARLEVQESPGRISVLVKPGAFTRFVLSPLLFALLLAFTTACVVALIRSLASQAWSEGIGPLVGAILCGLFTCVSFASFASSHEWILERGRVTRIDYLAGRPKSVQVFEGSLGVVPSVEMGPPPTVLRLVHAPDAAGKRTTVIESIDKDRADLAQWFNRVLLAP